MFVLRRPTDARMNELLEQSAAAPLTYRDVGLTAQERSPRGFKPSHHRVLLGHGMECFRLACEALSQWQMLPGYLERFPAMPALEEGEIVALRMRVPGIWIEMACRIVYTMDLVLPMGGLQYGFAYGTLPSHVQRGEERFLVEMQGDDSVWYDLYSFSRPHSRLAWMALPIARAYQRRFGLDSCRAMRDAVGGMR